MASLSDLFPSLFDVKVEESDTMVPKLKDGKEVEDALTYSELVDALWWCIYGLVYTAKEDRKSYPSLQESDGPCESGTDYCSNGGGMVTDLVKVLQWDTLRMSLDLHRFPKKHLTNRHAKQERRNQLRGHKKSLLETLNGLTGVCDSPLSNASVTMKKMAIDMIRCEQEALLGYDPDKVRDTRSKQFKDIADFIDSLRVHRLYVTKCDDLGGEVLTPEEMDEWDEARAFLTDVQTSPEIDVPYFIVRLLSMPSIALGSTAPCSEAS